MFSSPLTQNSILGLMILNTEVLTSDLSSNGIGIYYSRIFVKPSTHCWYQLNWIDSQSDSTFNKIISNVQIRTGDSLPYLDPIIGTRKYTLDDFNTRIKTESPNNIDAVLYKWSLGRSLLGIDPPPYTATTSEIIPLGTAKNTTRLSANTQFTLTSGNYIVPNTYPFGIQLNHIPKVNEVYISGFTETLFNSKIGTNEFYVNYTGSSAGFIQFNQAVTGTSMDIDYTYLNTRPDPVWNYWSLPFLHNKAYISNNVEHNYLQLRIELKSLDSLTNIDMYKITISSLLKKDRQPSELN